MAFVTLVSIGLSGLAMYFADAQVEGDVYFRVCPFCLSPATIVDRKIVLAGEIHEMPAGTVVATIEIKGRICTLRRIGEDGAPGAAECLEIDHLGVPLDNDGWTGHVLVVDNWKLYPASVMAWIKGLFR
ncbi:MAG: hypothetical protein HQ567_26690 [Candidatus Nealsonbacteria bacterium]|nr:hypothetical protein [Candidatus Nealsonbacteria bacterium]